jgi:hypothetical protein
VTLSPTDVAEAYALLAVLPFARPIDETLLRSLLAVYRAAGLSGQDVREAAAWAAQTLPAWPAPAQLIGRAREVRERQGGAPAETAEEAWGQVVRLMQSGWHGEGLPPRLSERARRAFAAACGPTWGAFWGTARSEDMVAHRARFVSAYQSASTLDRALLDHERRKRDEVVPALLGLVAGAPALTQIGRTDDARHG